MKKNIMLMAGGAILLSAVSCSIEENKIEPVSSDPRVPMEFTAGTVSTKTSLGSAADDEIPVLWSAGDAISIFDGTGNNRFEMTSEAGQPTATFAGEAIPDRTYYALYPYSATATYSETGISSVLPAEQHYVEGTFDTMLNPSVAVAENGNSNLEFHNVASVLQVKVNNIPDGKAVREIQAKADKSLAGAYTISGFSAVGGGEETLSTKAADTDILGVRLVSAESNGDISTGTAGVYYLVVFYGDYENLEVSVIYSDGSYSTRTYENVNMPVSGGNSLTFDASQATANAQGLYGLFMAGQDIYIGGKAYNKSQYEDNNKIKYISSGTVSIYNNSSSYGDGTIIFVEQEVNATFGNAGNIVVVGNDPEKKPIINKTSYTGLNVLADGSSKVIFSNVVLDLTKLESTQAYAFVANADNFPELTFDNCEIQMHDSKYLVGITNTNRSINKVIVTNCDIKVPASESNRYIIHTGSIDTAVEEVLITNNVFYCPEDYVYNFRVFSGSTYQTDSENETTTVQNNTDIGRLVFRNNTLVNLRYQNTALLVCNNISYAEISKNIVYFDQKYSSGNPINFLIATTNYPASAECRDNIVYDSNIIGGTPAYNMFYHSNYNNGVLGSNPDILSVSPLQVDFGNATFIPTTEYASYGAQR